jgi:phospholipid transport system substrate-binding protein
VKVLEDPALKGEDHRGDRRDAVRKLAGEIFDVEETAKRALGRHWQGRSAAEREEFVRLFGELLERTYIARIDQYGGERVRYVAETIDGETATVRGRVVTRQGTEIPVDARMLRKGDRWLMFDVSVENISMIANYRAQFDAIIRKTSYGELVQRLKTKQTEFLNEGAARPRS